MDKANIKNVVSSLDSLLLHFKFSIKKLSIKVTEFSTNWSYHETDASQLPSLSYQAGQINYIQINNSYKTLVSLRQWKLRE